jgi:very-short-patch-repair endonuclease
VDGGQHADSRDQARDVYLRQGWKILRFWNNGDVLQNRTGVLQPIAVALAREPSP